MVEAEDLHAVGEVALHDDEPRRDPVGHRAGGEVLERPAPKIEVVDTVGAGDTFHAGLLAWLDANGLLTPDSKQPRSTWWTYEAYGRMAGEVVETIDVPRGSGDVAVAFGSVWATSEHGQVLRLDPEP